MKCKQSMNLIVTADQEVAPVGQDSRRLEPITASLFARLPEFMAAASKSGEKLDYFGRRLSSVPGRGVLPLLSAPAKRLFLV